MSEDDSAGVCVPLGMERQQCQNCLADPPKDGNLLLCGGCRKTRYCDKSCQKADWKEHKLFCRERAQQGNLKIDTPRGSFTVQDLQDFCAVHRSTMLSAAVYAMGAYLDPPLYDEMECVMFIYVKYEPTLHHIPGRRFSLLDVNIFTQKELDHFPIGAAIRMRRVFQVEQKKQNPTKHFFMQLVQADHVRNILPAECHDDIAREDGAEAPDDWKRWLGIQFASGSSGSDDLS